MKRLFYLIILLLFANSISAQHIMGKVVGTDDKGKKEALPGANVYWQGTNIGTTTDLDGKFQLSNPDTIPAQLIVSMMGFLSDTISVSQLDKMDINIVLKNSVTLTAVEVSEKQSTTLNKLFTPINTEVISGKELLKAACCNLSESFSTNASVDVAFTDAVSGAKKIQMLGLDGVHTQILSENMPMLRGLSAAYGINYIPGTWIENILVTKGTGSVVNGYESISGQINLEFLKPQEQKHRFFINVYGNQKGRAEANIHAAKKVNEKLSTLLFTHASSNTMKQDMNKDGFLDMPLTQQYNVFNRWDFHNQKNFEAQFGIKGLYETRQGGQTNFVYAPERDSSNNYGIGINTRSLEYFSKTGFMFPSKPYKSVGIQTSGKWQEQDMYFGLRDYKGVQKNFYANVIYANIINNTNHKYKLGASYLLDDYDEKFNDTAFARTESVPGVFAEYTYSYPEKFSLVAGLRADYHNIHGVFYTPRLHLRWNATKKTTFRLSGGRGFRTSNVFVENQSVFASSRQIVMNEKLKPEIAWNYGVSANQQFKLFDNEAFINVDFFRTDFENQVIVDLDQHVNKVVFYNLQGQSYSHSLQVDMGFEPVKDFAIKMAYKWYDVKSTYNYELMDKPYVPKHRVMLNLAYATYMEKWKFDFTTNWLGKSRIPSTVLSPLEYQLPKYSKEYFLLNAQITKKFRKFETYLGCENILNYTQKNPIVASENPFGPNFDASMIYAPVEGRIIYVGLRMEIK
ncbi:MAG TPA: TonB-dependent receptor [Bacteroidia bacterium]|nr:TonB-dependent receptor [Bacteroidia bacterium]